MDIRRPRIGLFAGGIECYWVDMGMDKLPARLQQDIDRLIAMEPRPHKDLFAGAVGYIVVAATRNRVTYAMRLSIFSSSITSSIIISHPLNRVLL